MDPILEEIKPETVKRLSDLAKASGKSVDEIVRDLLPPLDPHAEDEETIGERLQRKGLIGVIDSSEPPDPASPPHRSALYELVADKFRKQGLKLP